MDSSAPLGLALEEYSELLGPDVEPVILTLTEDRGFIEQSVRFKKRLAVADTSKYKVIRKGDIAFNPYLLWAGAIAQNDFWSIGLLSPLYPTFRTRPGADSRYVWHMLRSPDALARFDRISFGSIPRKRRATTADFLTVPIPLPPLPEQRRIASILDSAQVIRQSRAKAQDSARRLLLEKHDRILDEENWPRTRFRELLLTPLRNGVSPSTKGSVGGHVLTLSAITRGWFDGSARKQGMFDRPIDDAKLTTRGEMLICRGNGNKSLVGRAELVTEVAPSTAFPDTMIAARLNLDRVDADYLRATWNGATVRAQLEAGARTTNGTFKVNQALLEDVLVPMPPLHLQRGFGELVAATRDLLAQQERHLAKLDELFAALQHRAFRGEL